MMMLRNKAV